MPYINAYRMADKTVYLLANGSMLNLTAGFGDSLNAFDVTLAVMASGIRHIVTEGMRAPAKVYLLPRGGLAAGPVNPAHRPHRGTMRSTIRMTARYRATQYCSAPAFPSGYTSRWRHPAGASPARRRCPLPRRMSISRYGRRPSASRAICAPFSADRCEGIR